MNKPTIKHTVNVALGEAALPVGTLTYSKGAGVNSPHLRMTPSGLQRHSALSCRLTSR
jgi:hypothetical protein